MSTSTLIQKFGLKLSLLIILFSNHQLSNAQIVSTYTFMGAVNPFTPIGIGTTVPAILADDANSNAIPIGFSFPFNGINYTHINAQSNLWCVLGTSNAMTIPFISYGTLTNAPNYPVIAPFWHDADGRASGAEAKYAVFGNAPNRVFIFEWLNWAQWTFTNPGSYSVQMELWENGQITFRYRQESGTQNPSTHVGIGSSTSDVINVQARTVNPAVASNGTNFVGVPNGFSYTFLPPTVSSPCYMPFTGCGASVTIPPIASYANTDFDTTFVSSPKVVVNTSNQANSSFWNIIGFNGTNKFGSYATWPENRTLKNSQGINDLFIDTIGNSRNFNYTFPQRGWYRVQLTALNQFGSDTYIDTLYVDTPSSKPRAEFFADRRVVGEFDFASFFDLSSNGPVSWNWFLRPAFYNPVSPLNVFGPSNTARNPDLNAFDGGLFDVCLVASNFRGSDTMCKINYMQILSGYQVCQGTSQTRDTMARENSGSAKLNTLAGIYQPSLIGTCAKGFTIAACADTVILNLERFRMRVNAGNTAADSVRVRVGSLTGSVVARYGGRNIPTAVSRRVSVPGGIAFIEVFINPALGTLVGDSGFVFRWESQLASYPKPTASFNIPDTIFSGYTQRYNNTSTGNNVTYAWDTDGDGAYGIDNVSAGIDSITTNPTRTFTVFTPYSAKICLKATNCKGSDTACKQVWFVPVTALPRANFSVNRQSGFTTDRFEFRDLTQNGPNQWQWRFAPDNVAYLNGTNSGSQNPIVLLNSATNYTVTLISANSLGIDSVVKVNVVTAIAFNTPGCSGCPQINGVSFLPNTVDIGISRVQLANMDTATALQTPIYHALFDRKTATVFRGVTYTLNVSRITSVEPMSTRGWIDFSRSTRFGDSPEEVIISEDNANKVVTSRTFSVPSNAPIGVTRMRIGVTYGNTTITDIVTTLGCYEDYGLEVGVDGVKPELTLIGSSLEKVEVNKLYQEKGVNATDNLEGNISSRYQVIGTVDITKVGYYVLKYTVSDYYGNVSDTVLRTVQVEVNQTGPVVTLTGNDSVYVEVYKGYVEQGATALSNTGLSLTSQIVRTGSVDTSILGTYSISYSVIDQFGFISTKIRKVVVGDTTHPIISTSTGTPTMNHQIGTPYQDPVTVTDNYWSGLVAMRTGVINPNVSGTYTLTYRSTDGSGNTSLPYTVSVTVRDLVPPVGSLLGSNPLVVDVYETYNDPGVNASDNYYPNVTVTIQDQPNTTKLGTYTVKYNLTDGAGNRTTLTRTVVVVDRKAPQIVLLGNNPLVQIRYKPFVNPGIKITDNFYSEATLSLPPYLTVDSTGLNTSIPGFQIITYRITDPSGNTSQVYRRFVNVVEVTSVNEFGENGNFSMYPNPTKDKVTVTAKNNTMITSYTLLDVLGRVVTSQSLAKTTELSIDMGDYQNGIYLLLLQDATGKTASHKVVKE